MAKRLIASAAVLAVIAGTAAWTLSHRSGPALSKAVAAQTQVQAPTPPPPQSPVSPKSVASSGTVDRDWAEVLEEVRGLGETDQEGLERLYARSSALIRADGPGVLRRLSASVGTWAGASLEESFFTMSAWIRSSAAPSAILHVLWSYTPPADNGIADPHHVALTPAVKYGRLEAYGLKELRLRMERDGTRLDPSARSALLAVLAPRARSEKSLNLSIEIFQLLAKMGERETIRSALAERSERDRQLIMGVLKSS